MEKNLEIKKFNHEMFGEIRTAIINGEMMFMATDVAKALGYKNPRHAVNAHCIKNDPTAMRSVYMPYEGNGGTTINVINEANLYRLVMRSKLPNAPIFQNWVFKNLLPSTLDKNENVINKPEESPNKIMAEAILAAQHTIEVNQSQINSLEMIVELQHNEINLLAPKAEYYDEIMELEEIYTTCQIADGLDLREQDLNQLLCEWGIQYKERNTWLLCNAYQDKGYMRIMPNRLDDSNGASFTTMNSKWTEKGRALIHQLYRDSKL